MMYSRLQRIRLLDTDLNRVCLPAISREYHVNKLSPDQASRNADIGLIESFKSGRRADKEH